MYIYTHIHVLTCNSAIGTSRNGNFSKLDGYFVKNLIKIAAPESVGVATGMAQVFLISAISSAFNAILYKSFRLVFFLTKKVYLVRLYCLVLPLVVAAMKKRVNLQKLVIFNRYDTSIKISISNFTYSHIFIRVYELLTLAIDICFCC